MLFKLNTEKEPYCFVGNIIFNEENPEQEVDLNQLTKDEKQIFNNLLFMKILESEESKIDLSSKEEEEKKEVSFLDEVNKKINEEQKKLSKILVLPVASLKKEAVSLSLKELLLLSRSEKTMKNRKSVLSFLDELISAKRSEKIQEEADTFGEIPLKKYSSQLSELVDGEDEDVVLLVHQT